MTDGENVMALPGVKLNDGSASEEIVRFLETVLEHARAGRVVSVGCAWVTPHGAVDLGHSWSGLPTRFQQLAADLLLLRAAEKLCDDD